jgi:hypothetical protein
MKFRVDPDVALLIALIGCGSAQAAPETAALNAGPLRLAAGLPLGSADLAQSVVAKTIAPGITHYTVHRGKQSSAQRWILLGDVAENDATADKLKTCFSQAGMQQRVAGFYIPGAPQEKYRIVFGGAFSSRAAALKASQTAAARDCRLYVRHSSEDYSDRSGPWEIDIVAIEPAKTRGRLAAVAADQSGSLRRRTSELANFAQAELGINGGFFVEKDADGFPGQPAGISILGGQINSAPVNKRPAVIIPNRDGAAIAIERNVDWDASLAWSDGASTHIDGINRKVGLVRNCGRASQDAPVHDHTCTHDDDLVYFPPGSRFATEAKEQVRFAIGATGAVRELAAGELPGPTDAMLAGDSGGKRIAEIREKGSGNMKASFKVSSSLLTKYGSDLSAVNAGPTLVAGGEYVREDAQEGWGMAAVSDPAHKLLMHDWINRRNPRTAIAVRPDGVTLLVTVDGHRHGASVGLTVEELRQLVKFLGARDAVNLDGGGSTAMVVRNRLINSPSDAGGERKVGDAIVFRAAR